VSALQTASVIRVVTPLGIDRRLLGLLASVGLLSLFAAEPVPAAVKDDHGEVRAAGTCSSGATSALRLKTRDSGIEVRFEVDHVRPGVVWRVVFVQERRIAWRGAAKTRSNGSFEVRRTLRDLLGADALTARAWGPRGLVCHATATFLDS
jgi:hypothetical protein